MKIQKLELKELEVIEVNGEYESRYINNKTYPVYLTNAALQKAYREGILQTSLIGELAKLIPYLESSNESEVLAQMDETQMLSVIFLAFQAANKNIDISFDEFLEVYHLDFSETVQLFANLITDTVSKTNNFAKGFVDSTKSEKKS